MGKLDYRARRELVTSLFLRNVKLHMEWVRSIQSKKRSSDRVGDYNRLLMKIAPVEFAAIGKHLYVYNGEYYEPMDVDNVKYGLDEFLFELGVEAIDRRERELHGYTKRIVERSKEHQLQPRLSLMCFQNCVVDFNTMKRYAFSPKLDVVKQYDFRYDRKQIFKCDIWNAFLGEAYFGNTKGVALEGVLPEKEKRRILQMFLGACLVDRRIMTFEYFLVMQGVGANGKSVINKVLSDIFGAEEMLNIKMSQFARSGDEGLRAIAAMQGKRMLHCTESSKFDFKDTSVLKALSSGEPMSGRGIGQNISTVVSPPLLIANSNFRWTKDDFSTPGDELDISVKRRAVIVNFEKSIPLEKRDTMLSERLRSERAGIFAWIVKGLVELRKNDWKLPDFANGGIDEKLQRLKSNISVFDDGTKVSGSFYEWLRLMTIEPRESVRCKCFMRSTSEILDKYASWCETIGIEAASLRKVGLDLNTLGYVRRGGLYALYVNDALISSRFDGYVPSLTDTDGFQGDEVSSEEFADGNDEEYIKDDADAEPVEQDVWGEDTHMGAKLRQDEDWQETRPSYNENPQDEKDEDC